MRTGRPTGTETALLEIVRITPSTEIETFVMGPQSCAASSTQDNAVAVGVGVGVAVAVPEEIEND